MNDQHITQARWCRVAWIVSSVALVGGLCFVDGSPVVAATTRSASARGVGYQRFTSCQKLRNYVLPLALEQVGPYGFGGGGRGGPVFAQTNGPVKKSAGGPPGTVLAAAPPDTAAAAADRAVTESANGASTSSTTNTQEVGVDEGDIVETDGKVVYAVINGVIRVVDITSGALLTTVALPPGSGDGQLLLDGKRLGLVTSQYSAVGPETTVTIYDVTNPASPAKLTVQHLEGAAVAVRSVNHRARLVLNTPFGQRLQPRLTPTGPLNTDADVQRAIKANRTIVKAAPITDWLPRTYAENADGSATAVRPALSCGEIGRPHQSSGLGTTWVATIDLDNGVAVPTVTGSAGVVAEAGIVYASTDTLYVATTQWQGQVWSGGRSVARTRPASAGTEITAFDMRPTDGAAWLATGLVRGYLLNQFSMSEFSGALRVATTRGDAGFGGSTESGVQVLQLSSADRRQLTVVGEVWGLGRGERVYAVRFVADLGYIVTFRQTDPLYVLDLRDVRAPKVTGELKINGYSAYLHPIGDGLIVGIGQDATDGGQRLGTQVSLFDVNDPANPKRIANLLVGGQSEAEYDHHAFLWWGATRNVVVPNQSYGQCCDPTGRAIAPPSFGAAVAAVGTAAAPAVTLKGRITHDRAVAATPTTPAPAVGGTPPPPQPPQPGEYYPIRRSLIVSGRLVTVSSKGMLSSDLSTLAEQVWVAFPGR